MKLVGVLGKKTALTDHIAQSDEQMKCICFEQIEPMHETLKWDVLLVLPAERTLLVDQLPACHLLIIAGEDCHLAHQSKADCVMTYGKGSKNSLSVSSFDTQQMAICIQRELVTWQGGSVERQEMLLPACKPVDEDSTLGHLCLALVLEKSNEEIKLALERSFE